MAYDRVGFYIVFFFKIIINKFQGHNFAITPSTDLYSIIVNYFNFSKFPRIQLLLATSVNRISLIEEMLYV